MGRVRPDFTAKRRTALLLVMILGFGFLAGLVAGPSLRSVVGALSIDCDDRFEAVATLIFFFDRLASVTPREPTPAAVDGDPDEDEVEIIYAL